MSSLSLMLLLWLNDKVDNLCDRDVNQCHAFCLNLAEKDPDLFSQVNSCKGVKERYEANSEIKSFLEAILLLFKAIQANEHPSATLTARPNRPIIAAKLMEKLKEAPVMGEGKAKFIDKALADEGFFISEFPKVPPPPLESYEPQPQRAKPVPNNTGTSIPAGGSQPRGVKAPSDIDPLAGFGPTDVLHGEQGREPYKTQLMELENSEGARNQRLLDLRPKKKLQTLDLKEYLPGMRATPAQKNIGGGGLSLFEQISMKIRELCALGRLKHCR